MRPKGVTDGQQVNIPALPKLDKDRWGDADRKLWCAMVSIQVKGDPERQIRRVVCQEKPLRRVRYPYHKPTQVDEMNILRRSGDGMFRN